jgi:hypothetical protein
MKPNPAIIETVLKDPLLVVGGSISTVSLTVTLSKPEIVFEINLKWNDFVTVSSVTVN